MATGISANRAELLQIANAVARKSRSKRHRLEAMEEAMQKAARSRYGPEHDIRVEIDPATGEMTPAAGTFRTSCRGWSKNPFNT